MERLIRDGLTFKLSIRLDRQKIEIKGEKPHYIVPQDTAGGSFEIYYGLLNDVIFVIPETTA